MNDFKWEMQERIDAGMSPDQAYEATRESYADAADLERKRAKENRPDERVVAIREDGSVRSEPDEEPPDLWERAAEAYKWQREGELMDEGRREEGT